MVLSIDHPFAELRCQVCFVIPGWGQTHRHERTPQPFYHVLCSPRPWSLGWAETPQSMLLYTILYPWLVTQGSRQTAYAPLAAKHSTDPDPCTYHKAHGLWIFLSQTLSLLQRVPIPCANKKAHHFSRSCLSLARSDAELAREGAHVKIADVARVAALALLRVEDSRSTVGVDAKANP